MTDSFPDLPDGLSTDQAAIWLQKQINDHVAFANYYSRLLSQIVELQKKERTIW